MKMELRRAALRRAGAQREAQERRHGHREPGGGQPEAVARGRHAAPGRGERPLPAGRVRRRPVAGPPRRGRGRVPRAGRVLPPHLPHRGPAAAARRRGAAPRRRRAATRSSSCRPTSAAARRTRCWRSTTCSPARRRASCRASTPCCRTPASASCRRRQARGAGRQQDLARATQRRSPTARWCARCGASWPGSSAARKAFERVAGRRRAGDEPGRRAARAVQRVRPVPDPDRRVGGLRAPAPRRRATCRPAASRRSSPSPRR